MKTEHYPSLELCKRLTETGFPQTEKEITDEGIINSMKSLLEEFSGVNERSFGYICPSIAELLDELPHFIKGKDEEQWEVLYELVVYASGSVAYQYSDGGLRVLIRLGKEGSIPDNLAEMWLFLKENNYI